MIKQTAFRFSGEDLAILDAIAAHVGTRSRSEALRVVIRSYARAEGLRVTTIRKGGKR
jgi:hypothetical protein